MGVLTGEGGTGYPTTSSAPFRDEVHGVGTTRGSPI